MPVLNRRQGGEGLGPIRDRGTGDRALGVRSREEAALMAHTLHQAGAMFAGPRKSLLATCANPHCASGWLHLLRSRSAPVFEGGWNCSAACTRARVQAAMWREMDGASRVEEIHRHRIPLGLMMLEQGWITAGQLRQALDAQRTAGAGRLGTWLIRKQGISEQLVTRALGLQWSCPVLPIDFHEIEPLAALVPRLFVDAFDVLPLRLAAGKLLYLGFEDRLDPVLALAIERMTGLRVESGVAPGSQFRAAHTRMLSVKFPPVDLIEVASETALVDVLAKAMERVRPAESRLVRIHDCLWLRMWLHSPSGPLPGINSVQDLICSKRA